MIVQEELALHLQYVDHGAGSRRKGMLWKVPFLETLGHMDMIRICARLKYIRMQPPEFDEDGRPEGYADQIKAILKAVPHAKRCRVHSALKRLYQVVVSEKRLRTYLASLN